jgi:hypothetical protein
MIVLTGATGNTGHVIVEEPLDWMLLTRWRVRLGRLPRPPA